MRPKTLPAAIAPILVGTAAAIHDHHFHFPGAAAALLCAMLLQTGANFANDYFDFIKGVDTDRRIGPQRVMQGGLVSSEQMRVAMAVVFFAACAVGLYLIAIGGMPIFFAGIASITAAVLYSGGPRPLASNALGEVFVFLFFGIVAVCGAYYVQALQLPARIIAFAFPPGLLITAILVVNNLRDIPSDTRTGKRTLAVILGPRNTRMEYITLLAMAFSAPFLFYSTGIITAPFVFLPLLSIPFAGFTIRTVLFEDGVELNKALAGTAKLALIYSLLMAAGLIL